MQDDVSDDVTFNESNVIVAHIFTYNIHIYISSTDQHLLFFCAAILA